MNEKSPNHTLSPMKCPVNLDEVDLLAPGHKNTGMNLMRYCIRNLPFTASPGKDSNPGPMATFLLNMKI